MGTWQHAAVLQHSVACHTIRCFVLFFFKRVWMSRKLQSHWRGERQKNICLWHSAPCLGLTRAHTCTCTHAGIQAGTSLGLLSGNFLLCWYNTNNTVYLKSHTPWPLFLCVKWKAWKCRIISSGPLSQTEENHTKGKLKLKRFLQDVEFKKGSLTPWKSPDWIMKSVGCRWTVWFALIILFVRRRSNIVLDHIRRDKGRVCFCYNRILVLLFQSQWLMS